MREIKCRGRDERGNWHYGYYVDGYMFDSMSGQAVNAPFIVQTQLERNARVVPQTVGQYTGIEDKNGKGIYHKDIVRSHDGLLYIVEWDEEEAMFYYKDSYGDEDCDLRMSAVSFEVIGNEHDNPELLKN
ncbi:YopX family protein (plasmid) [Bacillus thuringiensis]|uniref:YopX family protein n=1 Tax=Bacillus thuringiensis TaxID=1428 RepID=UPI0022249DBF|nr:YopX family protein [Bacillus thuringiensis]UYX56076.1 YopX family protein [Bacillus thuringiensis]